MNSNRWSPCQSPMQPRCPECGAALTYRPPAPESVDTEGEYTCPRCVLAIKRLNKGWFSRPALVLLKGEAA